MSEASPERQTCGLIMPISAIDGLPESHWNDIKKILSDAIEKAGFISNLVSDAGETGIIQKRIIQNLYDNPIVVCDVSGKNPNVMFELGMRLAFDKPTIIVKDDKTSYSFDTAFIEHLPYPRDLRHAQIVEFSEKLSEKIKATYDRASSDPDYTTFLKHFGQFTVAKLDKKEVSIQEYILEEIKALRASVQRLERPAESRGVIRLKTLETRLTGLTSERRSKISELLTQNIWVRDFQMSEGDPTRLSVLFDDKTSPDYIRKVERDIEAIGRVVAYSS